MVVEVSAAEDADDVLADAVGIRRRTLEKRNNSAKLFFMKGEASLTLEYNISGQKLLQE